MEKPTTIPLKDLVDRFGKIIQTEWVGNTDDGKPIWEDKLYTADELLAFEGRYLEDDFYQRNEDDDRVYVSWNYERAIILTDKGLEFIGPNGDWIQDELLSDKDLYILAGHDGFIVYNLIKRKKD